MGPWRSSPRLTCCPAPSSRAACKTFPMSIRSVWTSAWGTRCCETATASTGARPTCRTRLASCSIRRIAPRPRRQAARDPGLRFFGVRSPAGRRGPGAAGPRLAVGRIRRERGADRDRGAGGDRRSAGPCRTAHGRGRRGQRVFPPDAAWRSWRGRSRSRGRTPSFACTRRMRRVASGGPSTSSLRPWGTRFPAEGGLLVHAAGVVVDGRAFLLTGPSGAGKTTWARACAAAGLPVLSDDVVLLHADLERPCALGSPLRARDFPAPGRGRWPLAGLLLARHGTPDLAPTPLSAHECRPAGKCALRLGGRSSRGGALEPPAGAGSRARADLRPRSLLRPAATVVRALRRACAGARCRSPRLEGLGADPRLPCVVALDPAPAPARSPPEVAEAVDRGIAVHEGMASGGASA